MSAKTAVENKHIIIISYSRLINQPKRKKSDSDQLNKIKREKRKKNLPKSIQSYELLR